MAADFAAQFSITFPLYTDPTRETYQQMGWDRRIGIGAKSVKQGWNAWKEGFRQGKTQGDPWQQGGEAIILQDGSSWWSHPANEAGTHCSIDELRIQIDRVVQEME